jgi:predicted O-methyltransferase YrrM
MPIRAAIFRSYMDLLLQSTMSFMYEKAFGRHPGGCNIDAVAALVAAFDSSQYATKNMPDAKRFPSANALRDFAADRVPTNGMILEFGVYSGYSINRMATRLPKRKIYGFDSFEGLPENWRAGFPKASYSRKALPSVAKNVELVVGRFDDALPAFVAAHPEESLALLHVDCDLYSSTKTVFRFLGDRIVPGTIIVFDEYFNYPGWQLHEYRAFQEFVAASQLKYEYLGLVPSHAQVAVGIVGSG